MLWIWLCSALELLLIELIIREMTAFMLSVGVLFALGIVLIGLFFDTGQRLQQASGVQLLPQPRSQDQV